MELQLINQTTLSGEDLVDLLIKKEDERNSYIMDHPTWDILNQQCKELISAIAGSGNVSDLIDYYYQTPRIPIILDSGSYQCISSYEIHWIPEIMPDWEKMGIPIKLQYILSYSSGYHVNAYTLKEHAKAARL